MSTAAVAEYIRAHKQAIVDDWERTVLSDLKELARLERGALIDHLPEVLDGLGAWIEGRTEDAETSFAALADGHALQRLGFGVELAVVCIEYSWLRRVILRQLLSVPSSTDIREQLIRLNEGLDHAIHLAVRRYTERRDYVRDRFVSILGHDLRNPLSAAAMTNEVLLRSTTLTDCDRRRSQTIDRALRRMARMVSDVLDFARGHLGGGIPATPGACDMGEICRAAVEEAKSGHPERTIDIKIEGDLRGSFDRDRVLQVIGNLISNAIHHGQDPIVVTACEADDHRAIITRVSNLGPPIEPAMVPRLFEPFAHTGDEKKGSLGLGLYIVGQIARAHGGTYEVSSSDNETVFTIRWPRVPPEETGDRS